MQLHKQLLAGICCVVLMASQAYAINVVIDYTYDTSNFFGAGNPAGATAGLQARDSLEAAADYFSEILIDTFTGISTPPDYYSQVYNGIAMWEWTANFANPTTGSNMVLTDLTISADEYRVYVGARSLSGTTLGLGGVGGWGWSTDSNGGYFTYDEIDEINAITDDFSSDIETRGETSGFANWGGAIAFDKDSSTIWSFDRTSVPASGSSDFYSVAIHELAHALGFGSTEWEALISGSYFTGAASLTEYGSYPPVSPDHSHWNYNVTSTIYGTTTSQETAMDPDILDGTRKFFTTLDAAGMTDIGWDVVPPSLTDGDLNGDGYVGLGDLDIVLNHWNTNVIPGDLLLGDPSGDGYVGLGDLDIILNNWNTGTSSTTGLVVPEPMSLILLGLGITSLLRRC